VGDIDLELVLAGFAGALIVNARLQVSARRSAAGSSSTVIPRQHPKSCAIEPVIAM